MPKLTKRLVERDPEIQKDHILWDTEVIGFGVRITPNGRRSYLVQYRTAGNQSRRMTIGPHGVFTVDNAREQARGLLYRARLGDDPATKKRDLRCAPSMAELAEEYERRHASLKKRPSSCQADECNIRNHLLPGLGRRKVAEITRQDIVAFHENMRATPGAANRTLALLSKMFGLAEDWGYRPENSNPCRRIERYPERKMERFLSPEELGRLGAALQAAEERACERYEFAMIAAIRLLALTGARLGEILSLRWSDVDFEAACLRLPDSKTGPKTIHLNPPALEILVKMDRTAAPWVIQGRYPGEHLVNLRKPWHRLRKEAGLEGVRLHDLRHSFASVGAAGGLSLPLIGALLGHSNPNTTARYAHLAADPLKEANDLVGGRIAAAMQGQLGQLIPLPIARAQRR